MCSVTQEVSRSLVRDLSSLTGLLLKRWDIECNREFQPEHLFVMGKVTSWSLVATILKHNFLFAVRRRHLSVNAWLELLKRTSRLKQFERISAKELTAISLLQVFFLAKCHIWIDRKKENTVTQQKKNVNHSCNSNFQMTPSEHQWWYAI